MLGARQLRDFNQQQPGGASHVLPLQPGQAVPWVDLGKVWVGQSKHYLAIVHNTAAEEQELSVSQPSEGFYVADASGRAGCSWRVPANGTATLQVTFTPQKEGRVRTVLVFRFANSSEAGRLALSAAAISMGGAGPGPVGATALAQPLPRPAAPVPRLAKQCGPPAAAQPAQQHREKRVRAAAGLATPRGAPAPAAAAVGLSTPSVQPTKKAREVSRMDPPGAWTGTGARVATDPATPTHVVMRHSSDKPPGSVEEATPGAGPIVPRLQLGSTAAGPALGSSRFAQELAAAAQGGPPLSSKLGGSPALASARAGTAAVAMTFTHFHTSLWQDKQEAAFKAWLNMILLPAAADNSVGGGRTALASRRLTAKMRGLLWRIYQRDEQFRDVMLRVEQRVMEGQLRMRDEETCLKNLKEQAKVKEVLLSYHPFWLRLGMEVVANRVAASGDTVVSAADLEVFLRDWFLRDPDLAKKHAPNKAVNGLLPKAYWVQLGQLVLSRLLLLVALLDRAMSGAAALPQGVPLLFSLRSKIKASGQVLQSILPGWLSGEGDILRSLGRLGYKLQYEQQPKREIDFAVSNLAVDLRDGLRLCKLADILMGSDRLFEQARFPADKRPVKLHNVQLALGEFTRAGLSLEGMKTLKGLSSLQPMDVIDGDREKTLSLMWRLILHFQLPQLVNISAVRMEIDRIAAAGEGIGGGAPTGGSGALANPLSTSRSTDHVGLLLQWAQAVCAQFGEAVPNFTSAFADGHVFCLLIHFYLGPTYMPRKEIYMPDAAQRQPQSPGSSSSCSEEEDAEWRAMHRAHDASDPAAAARHRQGMAHNFDLVHRVAVALGDIPVMVSAGDILEHGPDEKAVVLFTAFLCQRLMEMSKEERAAMVMQRLWRRRQLQKPGTARAHLHRWVQAASVIQRAARTWLLRRGLQQFAERRRRCIAAVARLQAMWRARPHRRRYLQLRRAAVCIQAAFRGKLERRRVFQEVVVPHMLARGLQQKRLLERTRYQGRLLAAAVAMQALRRGSAQRRRFLRMRGAAITIQAAVRCHQASSSFQRLRSAAVVLQNWWRRRQAMQLLRRTKAAIVFQKHYRGHLARRELAAHNAAATRIQAAWRAHQQQQAYRQQRAAAVVMQAAIRRWAARLQYCKLRESAIIIQQHWRGHAVRQHVAEQRKAAIAIQAAWRGHAQRQRFAQLRAAAIFLQSLARRNTAMQQFHAVRQAAITIQRHTRGFLVRSARQRQKAAAVLIQAAWRCFQGRRCFQRQRWAAVLLQARMRGMQACKRYRQLRAAALCLQSAWRGRQARLLLKQHKAARAVQQVWRGYAVRKELEQQRAAAIRIQAAWRGFHARQHFLHQRRAAVLLQACVRGMHTRKRYQRLRDATLCFQAAWRARQARLLLKQHKAARVVQQLWRGYAVRRQLEHQRAAVVHIQAAWRGAVAKAQFQRQRRAATLVQAAFRGHAVRRVLARQRAAAVVVQAAWRGFATRRKLRQDQAALTIQRHARGFLARQRMALQLAAAVLIQRRFREHLDWKRRKAIEAMTRQMRELAKTMQLYSQRMAAALRIQAVWRGHVARRLYAEMLREHREKLRMQQEREAAALAVIAPWAGLFRDRTWFLRARKAVRVVQRWWRKRHAERVAAAVKLQAAARRFLAMKQLERSKQAATLIQAVWRGHHVCSSHPKAKRLADLRRRLAKANANAVGMAHMSLSARTRVALDGLLSCMHLTSASPHLESLALCTEASNVCCHMVAAGGGTAALLRLLQSAGRDKSCQDALRGALLCLAHLCRHRGRAEEVFHQEGLLMLLAKLLADHRDKEEVFVAATLLLHRLVADPARALALSRMGEVMAKCEGVARMLALRMQQEAKYLHKLEGQKGSDVSARQSTRALVSMTRQHTQLQRVLLLTGAPSAVPQVPASPGEDVSCSIGRNTIVRTTLAELQGR